MLYQLSHEVKLVRISDIAKRRNLLTANYESHSVHMHLLRVQLCCMILFEYAIPTPWRYLLTGQVSTPFLEPSSELITNYEFKFSRHFCVDQTRATLDKRYLTFFTCPFPHSCSKFLINFLDYFDLCKHFMKLLLFTKMH